MTYERCARIIKSTGAEPTRLWSSARRSIVNHAKLSWKDLPQETFCHAPRTRRG
ncbi:hypothetical protein ALC57_16416 [Trachymyrmex cornetzi]|uniref:Uncharacterized protein n=1 Tax=Trachymyrmex cornetzi TaxID=471704 RepID=A0A151IV45_9HYME|nr:hypothetical protein ALC57_16416 [Trachymyrmex cornetzi]